MAKEPQSKDEALDALDFIVNVLKEHEKDLDKLITELGTVAGKIGAVGDLSDKVGKVEQKINGLQNEIVSCMKYLSTLPREAPPVVQEQIREAGVVQKAASAQPLVTHGRQVILRCKQWEDFQNLALQSQTASFIFKDAEKTFQVQALRGNQIVTYSGELPKLTALLKMWLSKQLDVSEKQVLEGVLLSGFLLFICNA
jgi:hypothetical protein